jgi:OPT family oligopeptide transporter
LYLLTEGSSYWNYTIYNQTEILDDNYNVVQEKLDAYGLPWYSTTYVMYLMVSNVSLTAAVTHIGLYHGKAIWATVKSLWHGQRHQGKGDIHYEMMQKYKEVPAWWYYLLLLISFGIAMGMMYAAESTMPWWGLILAVVIAFIVTGVNSLMSSTTGFTISTEPMIQLIGGYVMPGKPVANMWFTLYGYNTIGQATSMITDLKIGHYMKIPPRALFTAQIAGTIIGGLLNYIMMLSIVENQREILLSPQGTNIWSGQNVQSFNSGAVTWGGLAHQLFSPGKTYYPVAWCFFIGFLVPVPFYLLHRRFPKVGFNSINTAIVVWFFGDLCVGINSSITMVLVLGIFFQFYVRKYHSRWFAKYQFIVSAALDSGTLFSVFVMTFAVFGAAGTTYPFPEWWGNPLADNIYPDHCWFDPRLAE